MNAYQAERARCHCDAAPAPAARTTTITSPFQPPFVPRAPSPPSLLGTTPIDFAPCPTKSRFKKGKPTREKAVAIIVEEYDTCS